MSSRPLRLACDLANSNQLREKRSGLPPAFIQGSATVVQVALFNNGAILADPVAAYDAITLLVKADIDSPTVYLQKTLLADVFTACSLSAWNDGSGQHVEFSLTGGDCSFAVGQHYFAIRGVTGESFTDLAYGTVKMISTAANPPDSEAAAEYYTRSETDALFAETLETAEGAAQTAVAARDVTTAARDTTLTYRDAAQSAKTQAETARDTTTAARDTTLTYRDAAQTAKTQSETARDTTLTYRDAAQLAKTQAETARDVTLGYRDTAQTKANEAAASANAANAVVLTNVAPHLAARAARPGIASTGTSAVGSTAGGLSVGTGDFTVLAWLLVPSGTPATNKHIVSVLNGTATAGFSLSLLTTGFLRSAFGKVGGAVLFPSTASASLVSNALSLVAASHTRNGNLVFSVNGVAVGASVSISAEVATSLSNTASPLTWFADQTNYTEGMLGECAIATSALSLAQIAEIYRVGSFAPFAASIAFHQWVDFGRGYGPIMPDRSGNNRHALLGSSGLSHAVSRNPPGIPQRAPRTALVFDGSNGAQALQALGAQDPASGELSWYVDFQGAFADATASTKAIAVLSSSNIGAIGAQTLVWFYDTTAAALTLRLTGATSADYRQLVSLSGLTTLLANTRTALCATRSGTTVAIYAGIAGEWLNITRLFTESTLGTAPAWSGAITGTYHVLAARNTTVNSALTIFDARLANVAMTEAQLRAEYERGEPALFWLRGNSASTVITGNACSFGASDANVATGWSAGTTAQAGARTGGAGAYFLRFTTAGGAFNEWLRAAILTTAIPLIPGMQVRFRFWAKADIDIPAIRVSLTTGGTIAQASMGTFSIVAASGWTQYSFVSNIASVYSGIGISFWVQTSNAYAMDVDDLEIYVEGWTARLLTSEGGGYQPKDGGSNALHFDLSTSGVEWSPPAPIGARIAVMRTFAHSGISTSAGTTLFGYLPPNFAWVEMNRNVDVAFDGAATIDLGTAGSPTRWLAAHSVTTTGMQQAASAQLFPQSTTAATATYIRRNGGTTTGNLLAIVETAERKF